MSGETLADSGVAARWNALVAEVNGLPPDGTPGVRDVDFPCAEFDGPGYTGSGRCDSDGHYLCRRCSLPSPEGFRRG